MNLTDEKIDLAFKNAEYFRYPVPNLKESQYIKNFLSCVPDLQSMGNKREDQLWQWHSIVQKTKEAFFALEQEGYQLKMCVAGGALRDWLVKPHSVGDVDVYISIVSNKAASSNWATFGGSAIEWPSLTSNIKSQYAMQSLEQLQNQMGVVVGHCKGKGESGGQNRESIQWAAWIIEQLKSRFLIEKIYLKSSIENEYSMGFIKLVVKARVDGVKVDFIFTQETSSLIMDMFDIDLCKAAWLVSDDLLQSGRILQLEHLYENLRFQSVMLKDVVAKSITIRQWHFSSQEIERFLNGHYIKLQNKYPEFELKIINNKRERDGELEYKAKALWQKQLLEKQNFLDPINQKNLESMVFKI